MYKSIQKGLKYVAGIVILAYIALNVLPQSIQPAFLSQFAQDKDYSLGLDLQGGSQLDYKIDLREVEEKDHKQVLDGILKVINQRVNSLGVNEPNIYLSNVGPEKHIVVELAGIKDLEEAKSVVGKTIQLEFKEENLELDPKEAQIAKAKFNEIFSQVSNDPSQFEFIGNSESQADATKITYQKFTGDRLADLNFEEVKNKLTTMQAGQVAKIDQELNFDMAGAFRPIVRRGYLVLKLNEKENKEVEVNVPKSVSVSHILISHNEVENLNAEVSKADAKAKAQDLLKQIQADPSKFESLGTEFSDDELKLEQPVSEQDSPYVKEFTAASLSLEKADEIYQEVVETQFGYHIIKADQVENSYNKAETQEIVSYEQIFVSSTPSPWKNTELTGRYLENAFLTFDQQNRPQVSLVFDKEGAKLFEQLTEANVGKQIAIFVGGAEISAPNVNEKIAGGNAVINGNFTFETASNLARDLKTGAIPAPITLSSQYTIGPNLGKIALDTSLQAGLIGLLLLALFMLLMYRTAGIFATIALSLYSILLLFVLKAALPGIVPMLISLILYFSILAKIFNSKEEGFEKFVSFVVATFALFFLSSLLANSVVLTLAGIAGIVLSIGMAVDANVLIFERIREEYAAKEDYQQAVSTGFAKAWSSIRDSNYSSLITCAILYFFGSSMIRGFALNLALGIYISMFSAIIITKGLMQSVEPSKTTLSKWFRLCGKFEHKHFKFIENQTITSAISIVLVAASLMSIFAQGLNLGIDFKGGSVLEIASNKEVSQTQMQATLDKFNEARELKSASVITIDENAFQIKTDYLTEENYSALIDTIENETESEITENKFETVGPSVSESLKSKAVVSLLIAIIAIILYIAISFRKIPRRMQPIKFGYAAIIALCHDAIIIMGIFSFFQLEINSLFITALLTVIGFSVHDTIVVFDRLRENLIHKKTESVVKIANTSLSQTLSRSLNTSISTLLTLGALYFLGAESLKNLNLALLLGIAVGTYSSIFIATTSLLKISKQK